jgi:hypothetical protein
MVDALGGWVNAIIFFVVICVIVFLARFIWNKSRPQVKVLSPFADSLTTENAANIVFRNFYKIRKFDTKDVVWTAMIAKAASILVPPGIHTLTFDYSEEGVGTGNGLTVQANTEAGKTYLLKSKITKSEFLRKELASFLLESKGNDLLEYLKSSSNLA